jgi:hypothetical protein
MLNFCDGQILTGDVKFGIGQNYPGILRVPISADIPIKSNLNFFRLYRNLVAPKGI